MKNNTNQDKNSGMTALLHMGEKSKNPSLQDQPESINKLHVQPLGRQNPAYKKVCGNEESDISSDFTTDEDDSKWNTMDRKKRNDQKKKKRKQKKNKLQHETAEKATKIVGVGPIDIEKVNKKTRSAQTLRR